MDSVDMSMYLLQYSCYKILLTENYKEEKEREQRFFALEKMFSPLAKPAKICSHKESLQIQSRVSLPFLKIETRFNETFY